jgi:4-hydroxy-2-oxoheptanedioate aldolase
MMQVPENRFAKALRLDQQQIGFWCSLASHVSLEILAGSGFDWLLLDTEHSPNEIPMVYSQLQACMENAVQPIVRPPWNDMVVIKRLLDAGVQTVLIPMIQSAEEARDAVAATRYPPRGVRGFASTSRSSRFGRIADYHRRCEAELCVLLQIETAAGLDKLEEIAAVEGVDGIFIGPGDLSAALGYLGNQDAPAFQAIVEDAIRRVRNCGKAPGILTSNESFARRCLDIGALFVAVGSDSGLLARGSEALLRRFRAGE